LNIALNTLRVSLLALTVAATAAHAEAPMQKGQAPGWYRMMLGSFEITALSDGTVNLPVDKLLKAKPGQVDALLARAYMKAPVETSVNAYLINTGSKLVLVDTGAAGLFGPTLGKLLVSLKASGYQPEQVDEIYITHMHADHVGGLMAGDKMAFQRLCDRWQAQALQHRQRRHRIDSRHQRHGRTRPHAWPQHFCC
jgi:glyoxylase-like metal-dependent hydrolase (beta-lactamase superfamily II)